MLMTMRWRAARSTTLAGTGTTQRGSTTVAPMPCARGARDLEADAAIGPTVTISTSLRAGLGEHVHAVVGRRTALDSAPTVPFGKRSTVGASSTATASPSSSARRSESRGAAMRMPGHDLQDRQVPDAVVARAVGAGDAGPVEHERDAGLVQGDIHQHLVEGAVDERRVDRDDRVQPAEREAGRRRRGVLLGDAHVEHAVGKRSAMRWRPVGRSMAAVMPTRSSSLAARLDELVGEDARPRRRGRGLEGLARLGVDLPTAWNWSATSCRAGS